MQPSEPAVVKRLRAAGCVFAEDEARLLSEAARTDAHLHEMVERRVGGLPLEQVIGWAEFCGLRVLLDEGVFVPRHRTELLVREVAALCRPGMVVVDLCCGSGAVGAALLAAVERVELHAVDIDAAAVRCAERNLGSSAAVHRGDLFEPLPDGLRGHVDVVVANTPYVPSADVELLPREARDHEPRAALDGGRDGLDVQRRVAAAATAWLAPGGHLLVETSDRQASAAVRIFTSSGLVARVARCDDLEATVIVGTWPGPTRPPIPRGRAS